jgi:hypothetical protein
LGNKTLVAEKKNENGGSRAVGDWAGDAKSAKSPKLPKPLKRRQKRQKKASPTNGTRLL